MTLTRDDAITTLAKIFRNRLNLDGKTPTQGQEADLQKLENPPPSGMKVVAKGLMAAIPATTPPPQTCCTYPIGQDTYRISGLTAGECTMLGGTLADGDCQPDNWPD